MLKRCISFLLAALLAVCVLLHAAAAKPEAQEIKLSASHLKHEISSTLYGIFIEDINYAVEGGLNANLVRNNSFEYLHGEEQSLSGWEISAEFTRETEGGMHENNPAYITLPDGKDRTVKNKGFCEYYRYKTKDISQKSADTGSMGIKAGEVYAFSAWFKNTDTTVNVYLENNKGEKLSETVMFRVCAGEEWQQYSAELSAAKTAEGSLVMKFDSGAVSLDYVCLYPKKSHGYGLPTWKYTSLRQDLYDALADMHPAFVRFPGGCVTEGDSLQNNFNWKNTIGPLEERKQFYNIWRNEDMDYNNSYSVGYHEYFQLCEDLGAAPVPILNVGLICQPRCGYDETYQKFKSGALTNLQWEAYLDTIALRPGTEEWDAYVQDILDLIEYANGDVSTEWGARRAENGHPAPFGLRYIGLGNENWGSVYFRNLAALKAAVNEKYPEITVISSSGPSSEGEEFDASWKELSANYTDTVVDEHYYQEDHWYLANTNRYDSYDRDSAKVFLGEYAATSKGVGTLQTKSNLKAAMAEAAYMTGLERNGDVVVMSSYAPLFAKSDAEQWDINLIWFDAYDTVRTPSYYVQMLFMNNTGTQYLDAPLPENSEGLYQSVTVDAENELMYIKLVNTSGTPRTVSYDLSEFGKVNHADVISLSNRSPAACNELRKTRIVPETQKMQTAGNPEIQADGYSVNILRVAYGSNKNGDKLYRLPKMPEASPYYTPLERALAIAVPAGAAVIAAGAVTIVWFKRKKQGK